MTNLPVTSDFVIPHHRCRLLLMHLHRPVFSFRQFPFVDTHVPYRTIPKRGVFPLALIGTIWKSHPWRWTITKRRNESWILPNESQACVSPRLHEKTCSNMSGDILPRNCSRPNRRQERYRDCASDQHEEVGSNRWGFNWEFSVVEGVPFSSLLWTCCTLPHGIDEVWSMFWQISEEWHELWRYSYSCLNAQECINHDDIFGLCIGEFTISIHSMMWSRPWIMEM